MVAIEDIPQHGHPLLELRFHTLTRAADSRVIEGVLARYGKAYELPWGYERLQAGALWWEAGDPILNVQHNRQQPLVREGSGLELSQEGDVLRVRAVLPETTIANDALALVDANVLQGFSVEMVVRKERMLNSNSLRIIEDAKILGLGLVDKPAYPDAQVERMRWMYDRFTYHATHTRYWI